MRKAETSEISPNGRRQAESRRKLKAHYDIAIIGAGLAGLSLARQMLLRCDKTILLLDRSAELPSKRQKVGESTVQVGGYYFSKVLDLEEYLVREHFLKYNLRFYWRRPGDAGRSYEDYSHSFIKPMSNIAGYQVNRNTLETEMLRLNTSSPNCTLRAPIKELAVSLHDEQPHELRFRFGNQSHRVTADWVVDTTGRGKFLHRRMELSRPSSIRHGSSFLWVDGLINIEKLSDLSLDEMMLRKDRAMTGHFPVWLATNHFVGEGFWFWVIPLQGKTSLGIVYDRALFPAEQVNTPEKLVNWVCREFPLFARDLPKRKILDHGLFRDFSYDCAQTISPSRWALSGESGRFSDPLYSPGSDLIAFHNTLILDAVLTDDSTLLAKKAGLYETLVRSLYQAYIPSYEVTYDVLGDQEAFILKYTWELAVYFTFFVFPFINQLFTNQEFILPFLAKLARLGRINSNLQTFISSFYRWKKSALNTEPQAPLAFDFTQIEPLRTSETLFYKIGLDADSALKTLDMHFENLRNLARFVVAHVASRVVNDDRVLESRAFVEGIRLNQITFDASAFQDLWDKVRSQSGKYPWPFDCQVLRPFRNSRLQSAEMPLTTHHSGARRDTIPQQA